MSDSPKMAKLRAKLAKLQRAHAKTLKYIEGMKQLRDSLRYDLIEAARAIQNQAVWEAQERVDAAKKVEYGRIAGLLSQLAQSQSPTGSETERK